MSNKISLFCRVICGITEETQRSHILRAAMEAICFQTRDILEAMRKDTGLPLSELWVDGGMIKNNLLMQLQADLCGVPVGKFKIKQLFKIACSCLLLLVANTMHYWTDTIN